MDQLHYGALHCVGTAKRSTAMSSPWPGGIHHLWISTFSMQNPEPVWATLVGGFDRYHLSFNYKLHVLVDNNTVQLG